MTHPTPVPSAPTGVNGCVTVPGSKSETNRALVLAALADGPSTVRGALASRDATLMEDALRALGVGITSTEPGTVHITPGTFKGGARIDCGLAGTVMRFVPPLVLLCDGPVFFVGDEHASRRPMSPLLDGLRQLGADVAGDALPFRVAPGEKTGGIVRIDASRSSQFVSGLLLVGAQLSGGLVVKHVGEQVPSAPHIAMTCAMLRQHGVEVTFSDDRTWAISEGPIHATDTFVQPDLTNAAVFLAAAAVAGGEVSVRGWPEVTTQPGAAFLPIAAAFGAEVEVIRGCALVRGEGALSAPGIIDLHEASELTPVVAALAAVANGQTKITGVGHIRGHETDRLAAITTELRRAGIEASETDDGLTIVGGAPQAAIFETYADHRMVHLAALLGLIAEGSSVTDLACVSKTMPRFPSLWQGIM